MFLSSLPTINPPRNAGKSSSVAVVIPSDPAEARQLQERIEKQLRERQIHEKDLFCIRLAIEEALVNAMKHGNQMDRAKKIFVHYRIDAHQFEIAIRDEGAGFDFDDVPDPTAVENLERPCGRGLMLIRYYMTEVAYSDRGNSVTMSKVFRRD